MVNIEEVFAGGQLRAHEVLSEKDCAKHRKWAAEKKKAFDGEDQLVIRLFTPNYIIVIVFILLCLLLTSLISFSTIRLYQLVIKLFLFFFVQTVNIAPSHSVIVFDFLGSPRRTVFLRHVEVIVTLSNQDVVRDNCAQ